MFKLAKKCFVKSLPFDTITGNLKLITRRKIIHYDVTEVFLKTKNEYEIRNHGRWYWCKAKETLK